MRSLLIVAALLALVPGAQAALADDITFTTTYYARVAEGDIPTTNATEADGMVNVIEYLRFEHPTDADTGESLIAFEPGHSGLECTCGGLTIQDGAVRVPSSTAAGTYHLAVARSIAVSEAYIVPLGVFGAGVADDAEINIYTPTDKDVESQAEGTTLPGAQGPWTIHTFRGTSADPLPTELYFAVLPASTAPAGPVTPESGGIGWLEIAIGILAGMVLWAWLVSKGFVQARSRKQVIQKAAHEEVAEVEAQESLAARKRVLMAGLKELEKAKMAKEIPDDVYDALKTELKKETVTIMRALDR